ncbi:MAG: hypothetical protein ACOYXR_02685 [Nitrospirota bacterium]
MESQFASDAMLCSGKSISGLWTLASGKPVEVTIHKANGQDEKIRAITA